MSDVAQSPELLNAFVLALKQYKPWHTPQWNSTGNDSFRHIIAGALKTGFHTVSSAAQTFGVSEECVGRWERGEDIPDRRIRKKIWSDLRRTAGLR